MRYNLFIIIQLLLFCTVQAKVQFPAGTTIVNGFGKKLAGTDFTYHSSIPVARACMLIRAVDGTSSMSWETAPVPAGISTEHVSFVWLAGIGSSPGLASFELAVNGTKKFTFWADGSDQWEFPGEQGIRLSFSKDMIDQHGDRFGFMVLTFPAASLVAGEALVISVTGGRFEKTTWYMTFNFPIENGLRFRTLPALTKSGDQHFQLGLAGILHFGEPAMARIWVGGQLLKESPLDFGYNHVRVELPVVKAETILPYRLEIEQQSWEGSVTLQAVRHWQVNFVQHTHTDIGYTRPQTEILAEHLRFIDYALDYCDITDSFPDEARFRWTCEASWAVDEYLKSRPRAQTGRLLQRVKENRIEITGMYFNFDELPDEQSLAASLAPLGRFRELGIEVKTAMQNDVNGIAWGLVDYFHDLGVRYLNMGTHGHRALICFDKPTLFWWESPSGKRMLAYRGEHYMIGNTQLKIHARDFNVFEEELLSYLGSLHDKGYEYDLIALQHSGFITDNSPPSTFACQMIRQWNEKYEWPRLRTATAADFFSIMETRHGASFPVIRGAWPDWWTDGFGASAREVAATRIAQNDLLANSTGLCMAAFQGTGLPDKVIDRIEACNNALLFYTEHTVGYHGSVREPFHLNTMEQRALKESYAWEASRRAKMLGEEALGLLQSLVKREKDPTILVFNTLNWSRSGWLKIYIDHQIIPRYTRFSIRDQQGRQAKAQALDHHSDGTYWAIWVDDIPAFGYRKYAINLDTNQGPPLSAKSNISSQIIENQWYRLSLDMEKGVVQSLYDKDCRQQLIDTLAEWKLGAFIYELLDNREQMEAFRLDNFQRLAPDKVWFDHYSQGEVWDALCFRGNTPAARDDGTYSLEIRLFNTCKRIDLEYTLDKKLVTGPEGIYNAFPFALEQGQWAFDVQGGEVRAGIDQVPGSANDWNTVQTYARLSNGRSQIILSSVEVPLMQFGGINTGRYQAGAVPEDTHVYGWPMNNYWTTNFNADQHGGHQWSYAITSDDTSDRVNAARFGWANRTPFLSRVLPGGGEGQASWEASLITGWPEALLLISAMPDQQGKSAVFHVRDLGGQESQFMPINGLTGKALPCYQVDVNGNDLNPSRQTIQALESKFFRVVF